MIRTVFNHIPKTGGTSIRHALAAALGEEFPVTDYTVAFPSHRSLILGAGNKKIIASHCFFYTGETLSPDWHYATVLRDPLGRFLSQYYFNRQHRNQILAGGAMGPIVAAATQKNLLEYLHDPNPEIQNNHTNWQARYFASRLCANLRGLNDDQLLRTAICSLEEYNLVGIYDNLQEFFEKYCEDLGIAATELPKLNVTKENTLVPKIPAELRDMVLARNRVDSALYEWAANRFAGNRRAQRRAPTAWSDRVSGAEAPLSFGDRQIEMLAVRMGGFGLMSPSVEPGATVKVSVACHATIIEPDLTIGYAIQNAEGHAIAGSNTRIVGVKVGVLQEGDFDIEMDFPAPENTGEYTITLALHKGLTHLDGCYHWWEHAARLSVKRGGFGWRKLWRSWRGNPGKAPRFRLVQIPSRKSRAE